MAKRKAKVTQMKPANSIVEDLQTQLDAANKARDERLDKLKEHVVSTMKTVSDKYRTVNGFMQARSTIDQVTFGDDTSVPMVWNKAALEMAADISRVAGEMAAKVEATHVDDITGDMFDDYMEADFIEKEFTVSSAANQLLVLSLLQNIGPSLEDIVTFRESTKEEIYKLMVAIEEQSADRTEE